MFILHTLLQVTSLVQKNECVYFVKNSKCALAITQKLW